MINSRSGSAINPREITDSSPAMRSRKASLLAFFAYSAGILADLVTLLNYNDYPIFTTEVFLLVIILTIFAGLISSLHYLAQPRISFIFTGIAIILLLDIGTNAESSLLAIIAFPILVTAWLFEKRVLKLMLAAFTTVLFFQTLELATGFGKPSYPIDETQHHQIMRKQAQKPLRPLVHLMMDSYIGIEGMASRDAFFGNLAEEQSSFYLKHGFQVYPQAYSRHGKTVNSLPEFLSYGHAPHAKVTRNVQYTIAPKLDYFEDLDHLGYKTTVVTPSFVDLCVNQPLTLCHNYNRSSLSALAASNLSTADRAWIIALTLVELGHIPSTLAAVIDQKLSGYDHRRRILFNRTKLYSLTGMQEFAKFTHDLESLRPGEARFVHLLLPHDPYILDRKCRILPESQWIDEHGPASFTGRDHAYARQLRCVTAGAIENLLKTLNATPAGQSAIVIIQGDHGSRTVDHVPISDESTPSNRAMTVTHSAFFAVRVPGESATVVTGRYALDELMGDFAARQFASAPRPASVRPHVYLMDTAWLPKKQVDLPDFNSPFTTN